ncbi:UDP-N-acetylmuramate dehydrogenase [Actinomycetaceae bacterium TAE3-ERU4]|nr:UDP-N-acetylmuramate dehydrogenase [Actinomycetaceae bacterium TAE3-ERU4]
MSVVPVASNRISVDLQAPSFADLTTMGVGGSISSYIEATSEEEIIAAVKAADEVSRPFYMIGGGSNTVAPVEPFEGVVVRDLRQELVVESESACGGVSVRVSAGMPWDTFVARAVESGWMGVEALSGIPGTVGAAPVQNIGAYGQEVAETIAAVRVWDRLLGRVRLLPLSDLELEYRNSILKRSLTEVGAGGGRTWGPTGRWVVLEVTFQMRQATLSSPIRYGQLAAELGVEIGERVESSLVREAVLRVRRSKGMVLDDADRDTWSAGSFFTNPIISLEEAERLAPDAPRFPVYERALAIGIDGKAPQVPGVTKVSAAWLIQHAGFAPGFSLPGSGAALSSRHTLAIVNRDGASAREIWELAKHIVAEVEKTFGIVLEPEPVCL